MAASLNCRTPARTRALEFLARILDANPDIEVGTDIIEEVKQREQECNTGIGLGVGVPHIRARREEGELFSAIGWSPKGIDYGASDGQPVHLVFMYYIPGAQKNVYLKEISTLVKAIRKSGGIDPIVHAVDLNDVRNQLLDWVSAALGDTGPEAVARMIKLEVKQTQVASVPVPAPAETAAGPGAGICGRWCFKCSWRDPTPLSCSRPRLSGSPPWKRKRAWPSAFQAAPPSPPPDARSM